ncbi:phage distal tail protein [Haloechinothrix alba]|nr:phage tail domain-containing protein [Haloechinothrix alba]
MITRDGQIEWRGMLLGSGTAFGLDELEGWLDLPSQDGSNQPLPDRHGAYPGRLLSEEREITFDFKTKAKPGEFRDAVHALRRATAPGEDPVEEPLAIRLDGQTLMCWARVTHRSIPTDKRYAIGYTEGAIRWVATDPRLYSAAEHTNATGLARASNDGLEFPLVFPLDFGEGTTGGVMYVENNGDVPTWPIFEVEGPCPGPVIQYSGRSLEFDSDLTVLQGQTLEIDTQPGNRTVELEGVSRRPRMTSAQWTPLEPGERTGIRFDAASYEEGARLRVRWRHAYQ